MLAMQYSIQLPPNFDAQKVRERVSERRGLFDGHGGLVHKSFLFNEKDHIYAPFYVWADLEKARNFLLDDLFHGVSEAFSRHRVRSWFVLEMQCGDKTIIPQFARREIDSIPAEEKLDGFVKQERSALQKICPLPGLYMQVLALDADRWEIVRFSLWADEATAPKPRGDCVQTYDVLHISEPA